VNFTFRSELGKVVPGDVADDLDDEPWCQRRVGVVELRREVLHASFSGVFDDAGADGITEAAEGFADQFVVHAHSGTSCASTGFVERAVLEEHDSNVVQCVGACG